MQLANVSCSCGRIERQIQRVKWQQHMAYLQASAAPSSPSAEGPAARVSSSEEIPPISREREGLDLGAASSLWLHRADVEDGTEEDALSDDGTPCPRLAANSKLHSCGLSLRVPDEMPSLRDLVAIIKGVGSALHRTGQAIGLRLLISLLESFQNMKHLVSMDTMTLQSIQV